MLPADALEALDRLPSAEALRRPLMPGDTSARRTARLLAGDVSGDQSMTIGDALFRWARVEPEALAESDIAGLHRMSEMVASVGRIPRRFGLAAEAARSAFTLSGESFTDGDQVLVTARTYLIQRLLGHLFDAQGCEVVVCGAEADPTAILLNGLQAVVHDPLTGPPTRIDRLTFVTQDILEWAQGLANNRLVFALIGMDTGTFSGLLPGPDVLGTVLDDGFEICMYTNAAAQAGRMLIRRDINALGNLASLASASVAGHVGHIAGKAAAFALLGVTGSWMVVLAPVAAGFAGRVAAKGLVRRARYELFCRREVAALREAISMADSSLVANTPGCPDSLGWLDGSSETQADGH